jgi:nitrogen regulatory protein PII
MKMVTAYFQPYVTDKVARALQEIADVPGLSLIEVRGFGRGRGKREFAALAVQTSEYNTLRKVRIETVIPDHLEDEVVEAIRKAAFTGHHGDGKIYVTEIRRAVRIRTGEEGNAAC